MSNKIVTARAKSDIYEMMRFTPDNMVDMIQWVGSDFCALTNGDIIDSTGLIDISNIKHTDNANSFSNMVLYVKDSMCGYDDIHVIKVVYDDWLVWCPIFGYHVYDDATAHNIFNFD